MFGPPSFTLIVVSGLLFLRQLTNYSLTLRTSPEVVQSISVPTEILQLLSKVTPANAATLDGIGAAT